MRYFIALLLALLLASAPARAELQVLEHSPLPGATAVPRTTEISVTFDGPVSAADATAAPIRVFTAQGALVPCTFGNDGPNTVTLTPEAQLPAGMQMTVHLPAGLTGGGGEVLPRGYQWSFRTGSTPTGLNFHPELIYQGSQPFALAAGDYDENGTTDITVVEGAVWNEAVILLNDGAGNFTVTSPISIADNPVHAISQDVDLDGHLDLVVGHWSSQRISVLMGNGTGSFAPAVEYPLGASAHKLTAGDLDGDGFPELLSANMSQGNLSILWNHGDGTFTVDPPVTEGSGTRDVRLWDLDGDGDLDIIVAATNEGYGIHRNDGTGNFVWFETVLPALPVPLEPGEVAHSVAIGPNISEGGIGIVGATNGPHSRATTYYSSSGLPFGSDNTATSLGPYADYSMIADIDADRTADLLYVNYLDGTINLRLGHQSAWEPGLLASVPDAYISPDPSLGDIRNLICADFDGTGSVDWVSAYRQGGAVYLWHNDSPNPETAPEWRTESIAVSPGLSDGFYRATIAIDVNDAIHIGTTSYDGNEEVLTYVTNADGGWYSEAIDLIAEANLFDHVAVSMTVSNTGQPSFAYLSPQGTAQYAVREGGVWNIEPLASAFTTALAVDNQGNPAVVLLTYDRGVEVHLKKDGSWAVEHPEGVTSVGDWTDYVSAAFDSQGRLHIALGMTSDLPRRSCALYHLIREDSDWTTERLDEGVWGMVDMDVTPDGLVSIAYVVKRFSFGSDYSAPKLAHWDGARWHKEYLDRSGAIEALDIVASASGDHWIPSGSSLYHKSGSTWARSPIPASVDGYYGIRMALDSEGQLWAVPAMAASAVLYTTSPPDDVTAVDPGAGTPERRAFALGDAIPNPFNPRTTISYAIPQAGHVELEIYDLAGRHVRTLVSATVTAGEHEVSWTGQDDAGSQVASGVYLYQLRAGEYVETKRMVLVK